MIERGSCTAGTIITAPDGPGYVGEYGYCKHPLVLYENQGAGEGVQSEGPGYYFPRDMSAEGWRMDWLINVTMVMVLLLFGIMCVWIAWAAIGHDEKHDAVYDHGAGKHHVLVALGVSAVIFFIMDGNLFYNSMVDLEDVYWNYDLAENLQGGPQSGAARPECAMGVGGDSSECATRIEINARQWAWEARYTGADGKFDTPDDVVTLNEVVIPTHAPVIMNIGAVDVIHSFNIPHMRQKIDAVPGVINRLWFEAVETGDVEIACAQHCGAAHYKMRGLMRVLSPEDYRAWAEQAMAHAVQAYNATDEDAHWGWAWRTN
jgi:cytochrome c oxidase subunit 2